MNRTKHIIFTLLCVFTFSPGKAQKAETKPNIIFILMDDLGYGDIGALFQQQNSRQGFPSIHTPHLDSLARNGAILTHYAAAPVCAPSRASLLTGVSQGQANVRDNQFDKALEDNYTLGNVLQKAGYVTAAIGKWGLQGKTEGPNWPAHPLKRGFDYYYGYITHKNGHEHYPIEGIYRGPQKVWENYQEITEGLNKCYTGDLFTAKAKDFIKQQSQNRDKPFFIYLAYDTPHAALELPTQEYPDGKGLKGGLQWLEKKGEMINTATGIPDSWVNPKYANTTYDDDNDPSSPEVAWPDTYKRYATIVTRIDNQIGDIVKLLSDLKISENTLLVFSSDNGPSAESYLPKEYVDYKPSFFNSFGPFSGIKRDVLEGGLRVPTIAVWPGKIPPGVIMEEPSISYDWLPTFAAAAGITAPARTNGVSILPHLTGNGEQLMSEIYVEYHHKGKTPLYPQFPCHLTGRTRGQMQMIRLGDYVGVRYNIKSADDDFEIYNVKTDFRQKDNLNEAENIGIQQRMKSKVLRIRMANNSAPRPYDNIPMPAVKEESVITGIKWTSFSNKVPWLSSEKGLEVLKTGEVKTIDALLNTKLQPGTLYVLEAYIRVPEDKYYTFNLKTDGKAFVRIHQAAVIDADYNYLPGEVKKGGLMLENGYHPVKIYYAPSKQKHILDLQLLDELGNQQNKEFYIQKV